MSRTAAKCTPGPSPYPCSDASCVAFTLRREGCIRSANYDLRILRMNWLPWCSISKKFAFSGAGL